MANLSKYNLLLLQSLNIQRYDTDIRTGMAGDICNDLQISTFEINVIPETYRQNIYQIR
jgi:hypothetical protein